MVALGVGRLEAVHLTDGAESRVAEEGGEFALRAVKTDAVAKPVTKRHSSSWLAGIQFPGVKVENDGSSFMFVDPPDASSNKC